MLSLSIFTMGAFAGDCDVEITLANDQKVTEDVCLIQNGGAAGSEYKAKFDSCGCADKQIAEVEGNAETIKHCDTDRITPQYEYTPGSNGGAGSVKAITR